MNNSKNEILIVFQADFQGSTFLVGRIKSDSDLC